jgi:hypothetical protein
MGDFDSDIISWFFSSDDDASFGVAICTGDHLGFPGVSIEGRDFVTGRTLEALFYHIFPLPLYFIR